MNPALGFASAAIPPIAKSIPYGDAAASLALGIGFDALRYGSQYLLSNKNKIRSGESEHDNSDSWRYMLADRRLAKIVADVIANRSNHNDGIAKAFEEERSANNGGDSLFDYQDSIRIPTKDPNITLSAFLMQPKVAKKQSTLFPAIIFVNSWSFTEHEYVVQAARFAKKGYIVLAYCTRGFGKSDGMVDVAGPKDMEDIGCVLDWLEANSNVDKSNIGISGISYGAG